MAVKTETETESDFDSDTFGELSAFQRDMLAIIAEKDEEYGLGIKREMRDLYGDEINHGRLYPNLNTLNEMGLIDKEPLDKRTNGYSITPDGRDAVKHLSTWLDVCLGNNEDNNGAEN